MKHIKLFLMMKKRSSMICLEHLVEHEIHFLEHKLNLDDFEVLKICLVDEQDSNKQVDEDLNSIWKICLDQDNNKLDEIHLDDNNKLDKNQKQNL